MARATPEHIYETIFDGDDTPAYQVQKQWHALCEMRARVLNRYLQNDQLVRSFRGDLSIICYATWTEKDIVTAQGEWYETLSDARKALYECYGKRLSMWIAYDRLVSGGELLAFTEHDNYQPFYLRVHTSRGIPCAFSTYDAQKRAMSKRVKITARELRRWLFNLVEVYAVE